MDFGGSGIKGAPVDLVAGDFAADRVRIETPHPATPEAVAGVVAELLAHFPGTTGTVGVTVPAVVRHGVVESAANIDDSWIGTDADALLTEATGHEVHIVNDADAAGVAEVAFGAARGQQGLVVVTTLGTGIGSALVHDGVLVPNTELGHLPMKGGGAEQWAAESVREREELSWKKWAHRLSEYFALLERLYWPDLIIVGGGVSKKAHKFLPHVRSNTEVVPAALHNDAGIVGAALSAPT